MCLIINLGLGEDISGLLRESLLKQAIGGDNRSVTLILWNNAIFPLNRFESVMHIVVGSPIHVVTGPLEEALLGNAASLSVPRVIKFIFRFSKVGVIKLGSCLTLAHF